MSCDAQVLAVACSFRHEGTNWQVLGIIGVNLMILDSETGRQLWWSMDPNVVFRTPKGRLEAQLPLLMAIGAHDPRMAADAPATHGQDEPDPGQGCS
ncbi:MAG: hypothetical protein PF961_22505 [Planctomycetota bacterium]|jgi:hypothetical protein|nr:hypothetical protein [Planctomycetota bacterium]